MPAYLQEFIEKHYKKIKINDKLRTKVDKHLYVTKSLFNHYEIDQKLEVPLVEYSRYVLASGTGIEKTALAAGIITKLHIRNGNIRFQKEISITDSLTVERS